MNKLRIVWFWIVSFYVIIWNIIKGNQWHMIYADFHLGNDENDRPIRKQLIARKTCNGLEVYWQDLSMIYRNNDGNEE